MPYGSSFRILPSSPLADSPGMPPSCSGRIAFCRWSPGSAYDPLCWLSAGMEGSPPSCCLRLPSLPPRAEPATRRASPPPPSGCLRTMTWYAETAGCLAALSRKHASRLNHHVSQPCISASLSSVVFCVMGLSGLGRYDHRALLPASGMVLECRLVCCGRHLMPLACWRRLQPPDFAKANSSRGGMATVSPRRMPSKLPGGLAALELLAVAAGHERGLDLRSDRESE